MGVSGKGQSNPRRYSRKNIRLVREQDDRVIGLDLRQRAREIVDAAEAARSDAMGDLIADTGNPDPLALRTEQDRLIFQERYAHARKRAAHAGEIVPPVVIAEYRPNPERRLQAPLAPPPRPGRGCVQSRSDSARCSRPA